MKKILIGAGAVIAVAAVSFSGSANTACYWTGYNWNCASPRVYYQPYTYQYGYQPYTGIPSRTPTGPTRTGIRRVIRARRPAATAVINRL